MRSVNENPTDPLGNLGPVIRDKGDAKPDPVSDFTTKKHELINNQSNAMETIAETLRKKADAGVAVTDGQEADWEGLCLPRIMWRWTRIGFTFDGREWRDWWEDRWHFDGGHEDGYATERDAKLARAALAMGTYAKAEADRLCSIATAIDIPSVKSRDSLSPHPVLPSGARPGDTLTFRRPIPYGAKPADVRLVDGEEEA